MLIGLKRGDTSLEYRMVSAISRIEGRTGKIQVPRATYSFRMSFWMVPVSLPRGTFCLSATARYMAYTMAAVPLIVNAVDMLDRPSPSNRLTASLRFATENPTLPLSCRALGSVGYTPHLG